MSLIDREYMYKQDNRIERPFIIRVKWNWNKTFEGLFIIGILFFGLSIVLQNLVFLNSINSHIPVGILLLIILSIASASHIFQVLKWYLTVMRASYNYTHKAVGRIIIHACLYLIVIAFALSIPLNLNSPQLLPTDYAPIRNTFSDISEDISNIQTKLSNPYPQIIGASKQEYPYIQNILNNTKPEVRNNIASVNVVSDSNIITYCGYDAIGCAFNDGRIYVVPLSFWNSPHLMQNEYIEAGSGYVRCSTFAWTLNHEIGHIKGYMVGDESEVFAENYAFDHTTVNLVYEPEDKC